MPTPRRPPDHIWTPEESAREQAESLLRLRAELDGTPRRRPHAGGAPRRRTRRREVRFPHEYAFDPAAAVVPRGTTPPTVDTCSYTSDTGLPRYHPPRPRNTAWAREVGPPPLCGPGEFYRATLYHNALLRAWESPERAGWPRADREALRHAERVWRRRASGDDVRFRLVGNKPGALSAHLEAECKRLKAERRMP